MFASDWCGDSTQGSPVQAGVCAGSHTPKISALLSSASLCLGCHTHLSSAESSPPSQFAACWGKQGDASAQESPQLWDVGIYGRVSLAEKILQSFNFGWLTWLTDRHLNKAFPQTLHCGFNFFFRFYFKFLELFC